MLVLVANLGSTSFKFKVLDSDKNYEVVARGGYDRIGTPGGDFASHEAVIDHVLPTLPRVPDAIGFKAVHGGPISGAVRVTDDVLATMESFADVAPAHNPVYVRAMKSLRDKLPAVPQVAAFETAFHSSIPASRQHYAIPHAWTENYGIRRYGFHGASHRYVSERARELVPGARRMVHCHLGGSSSLCATVDGRSVAVSMGLTPQTGLPQNNRVGDFDIFALPKLLASGLTIEQILKTLGKESGLLGISGTSNDMRDLEALASQVAAPSASCGSPTNATRAAHAIDVYVESVRHYLGAFVVAAGGIDLLTFTGGIGENSSLVRIKVCQGLEWLGIELDPAAVVERNRDVRVDSGKRPVQVWIIPTDEERVVARQTVDVLTQSN